MKVELRKCIHCGKECDPEFEELVYDLINHEPWTWNTWHYQCQQQAEMDLESEAS